MKVWVVVDSYDSASRVFSSEAAARKVVAKWIREYRGADYPVSVDRSGRCWRVEQCDGMESYITLDPKEVEE